MPSGLVPPPEGMTDRAKTALLEVDHIVGYTTYIDLIPDEVTEDRRTADTPMRRSVPH